MPSGGGEDDVVEPVRRQCGILPDKKEGSRAF